MIRILPFAFCLLASSVAAAQSTPATPPLQEVPYLPQGRPAPFEGFLIRGPDLAQWKLRILVLEHQLDMTVTTEHRVAEVETRLNSARVQAVEERLALRDRLWTEQTTVLIKDLARARQAAIRSWYESPTLWFAVGVLITAVLSVTLVSM